MEADMAIISPAFVTTFDVMVKQAFQGMQSLAGTCRERMNVEGTTHKFPKLAKGAASQRIPQTDVTPINAAYSSVSVTLEDWNAAEYSDIFNQAKVNFDDVRELSQVVGNAIGRRIDQMKIDALDTASSSLTVAKTVVTSGSATASNLNVGKIIEAARLLDANNVPPEDRIFLAHANSKAGLMGDDRAISGDYQTARALASGVVSDFLGFKFVFIGDRDEGGLTLSTNDRQCFAFHKSALGYAQGLLKTEINYVPEKTSFLVNSCLAANAVSIDATGIVEITCDES
jgi:hypothetical protein